jgi:poly-gamma-glutamate capsule biosynthesis protein CapA/YwtB (metallophosphatase superfamily)
VHSGRPPRRGPGVATWAVAAVTVALLVGGLVVAARDRQPAARPATGPAPATVPAAASTPAPATNPPAARITLAFAGDVHFAGRTATRLAADPATAFGEAAAALRSADLTMVNLETAVTERGSPEPKEFHFRAPATAFAALRAAGVDVATMANNHAADYGAVGLTDTLAAIRSSRLPTIGIGPDAEHAYAPYDVTVRGHRVALLAASQIRDRTLAAWTAGPASPGIASGYDDRLVAAVGAARQRAEIVVVYLHWGIEGQGCPSGDQRALAARLAAAGADAVVGTHAHLLLGAGYLGPTYVAYGLGNYLWWRDSAFSNDTGVLRLTFAGRRVVAAALAPARIDGRGVPVPATGDTAARIQRRWSGLVGCTGLAARPG